MKKMFSLISGFAGIFFFVQLFSYLDSNGLTWNTESFVFHIKLFFAVLVVDILIVGLIQLIKKPNTQPEEPIIDERTEKMHFKFTGFMFIFSYFILLIITGYLLLKSQGTIPTEYLFYYSFIVLFITMVAGPMVIRKL